MIGSLFIWKKYTIPLRLAACQFPALKVGAVPPPPYVSSRTVPNPATPDVYSARGEPLEPYSAMLYSATAPAVAKPSLNSLPLPKNNTVSVPSASINSWITVTSFEPKVPLDVLTFW